MRFALDEDAPPMTLETLIAEGMRAPRRRPVASATPARWSLRAETVSAPVHLYLYDAIGWPGIEAGAVAEGLRAVHTRPVTVHLNSNGGDVFDGLAIYNTLRSHGAPVDVRVEGLAASIASLIAMGGSTLRMAAASLFMIHEPGALVIGNAHDMRHMAGLLDKATGVLADVYTSRGARPRSGPRVDARGDVVGRRPRRSRPGLIDAVDDAPVPAEAAAASATFDLSAFRHAPGASPRRRPRPPRRRRHGRAPARAISSPASNCSWAPRRRRRPSHDQDHPGRDARVPRPDQDAGRQPPRRRTAT